MSNAILSRFDLVFLLLDDPDLQRDKKLSEHVMKLHSRNRKRKMGEVSGGPSQEGNIPAFSLSLADDIDSTPSAKRFKPTTSDSLAEDDEIQIIHQSQSGEEIYTSLNQRIKTQCDRIPESEMI